MITVTRKENETLDQMLRRFKNLAISEGILDDIKRQEYYKSPSQKRKEKREKNARKRWVEEQKAKRYYKAD